MRLQLQNCSHHGQIIDLHCMIQVLEGLVLRTRSSALTASSVAISLEYGQQVSRFSCAVWCSNLCVCVCVFFVLFCFVFCFVLFFSLQKPRCKNAKNRASPARLVALARKPTRGSCLQSSLPLHCSLACVALSMLSKIIHTSDR